MKKIILFILMLPLFSYTQHIENVRAEQDSKKINIYYNITGAKSGQTFNVKIYCSTNGGQTWGSPLYYVSGDVGKNISGGYNKHIVWDILREREKLTGDHICFEIRATSYGSMEMVFVKGDCFKMGSKEYKNEKPIHKVCVDDYYIGKYEVTQKQWLEIMGSNPSYFKNCDNCPVEHVSWNDVQEFIKKLNQKTEQNYRLPREAEWEYAAKGGIETIHESSQTKYAGSNNIGDVAWYTSNSGNETHKVGTKQANELGIYDMSGNVWEWCSDWYGSDYYKNSPRNDPQGPSSGTCRVLRGGSWYDLAGNCRVANRGGSSPGLTSFNDGFRLAR
jgi:formylglycine-generating enzyme required for sulfatase activity